MRRVDVGTTLYSADWPTEALFILKVESGARPAVPLETRWGMFTTAVLEAGASFTGMVRLGQTLDERDAAAVSPCQLSLLSCI